MVAAIVFFAVNGATQRRKATLATIEEAIRGGQQVTPEMVKALGMPKKDTGGDLKSGAILIAVALALVVLGQVISAVEPGGDADEAAYIFLGFAAFPGFIGLVLLAFGFFGNKTKEKA